MSKLKNLPDSIAIVGPTATGKTIIGAQLAKFLESEVISADSQLVYKELDIGVAKPTQEEMQGVSHHMIGIVPPTQQFSAGHYTEQAEPILDRLMGENKIPVIVGGTGFYLKALLQPQHLPKVPFNEDLRNALYQEAETHGNDILHQKLKKLDPERAEDIHPHNIIRVVRALEIIEFTGKPIPKTPEEPKYNTRIIGLTYADREKQLNRVWQRLNQMVKNGFIEEVEALYQKYGDCYALQTAHGYPELLEVIQGKRPLDDALEQININIRQYTRRQITWFKRLKGIQWAKVDEESADTIVTNILQHIQIKTI